MVALKLYNTLTRSKDDFAPLQPGWPVGLYTCGPTVYNFLHVGNYRTYVFEDALRRTLQYLGLPVRHVMNITDVGHLTSQADEGEDKMELGAAREGKTAWQIAEFYTKSFVEESASLNLLKPEVLCRATDHIPEQLDLVRRLEAKGFTYRTSDGIYFDTAKIFGYGRLMGAAHIEGLREGARVQANPEKRNPTDFALWKFSPQASERQMEWDSPWGRGFPGWHIECSAMAMKYLGDTLDIHCGGVDHIPIHHTNEIAQSEAATGKPFVRFWLHGEFLVMNKAKMAKSSGDFVRLKDVSDRGFHPLDYRYLCFTAHYRKQLDFSWEALEGAKSARRRLRERALDLNSRFSSAQDGAAAPIASEAALPRVNARSAARDAVEYFKQRIADDLDMPGALAVLWDHLKPGALEPSAQAGLLREADKVLALGLAEPAEEELPPELKGLFDRYAEARAKKDYPTSDDLRRRLMDAGVRVVDTPEGSRWKRV